MELQRIAATELFDVLREEVGQIIFNGFPTGVMCCRPWSMAARFRQRPGWKASSARNLAIERFAASSVFSGRPARDFAVGVGGQETRILSGIWRLVDG